jgi:hypothetical protein
MCLHVFCYDKEIVWESVWSRDLMRTILRRYFESLLMEGERIRDFFL